MGLLALILFPWFASHSGKSLEFRSIEAKVRPLIERYRAEVGSWPSSWGQIEARYHPAPDYKYELLCDDHPWRHFRSGTLTGLRLRRGKDEEGVVVYELQTRDGLGWPPVFVTQNP